MRWTTVAMIAMPLVLAGVLAISADNKNKPLTPPRSSSMNAAPSAVGVVPETREVPQPPLAHSAAPAVRPGRRAPDQDLAPSLELSRARKDPASAVHAYADQSTTWTWRTLARQYGRLAKLSGGRLQRVNLAAARDTAALLALRRDGAGSRARVLRVRVVDHVGEAKAIVGVLTLERGYGRHANIPGWTRGQYRAVARRLRGRWQVAAWEPQS